MSFDMNDETVDAIIRSRSVVLEVLEERGFDTKEYKDELPADLISKSLAPLYLDIEADLLRIQVPAKKGDAKAHVLYWMATTKHKLNDKEKFERLLPPDLIRTGDSLIILLNESVHEAFHKMAIRRLGPTKEQLSFFHIRQLITHPGKHILVPRHERVPSEEVDDLLKHLLVKSRVELPHIKYHVDMQARLLGLVPGDIVKIVRPSPTVGEYSIYRICVP